VNEVKDDHMLIQPCERDVSFMCLRCPEPAANLFCVNACLQVLLFAYLEEITDDNSRQVRRYLIFFGCYIVTDFRCVNSKNALAPSG
jgi:hypothetical protein